MLATFADISVLTWTFAYLGFAVGFTLITATIVVAIKILKK